jgi:hypothetical protein
MSLPRNGSLRIQTFELSTKEFATGTTAVKAAIPSH